MLKVICCPVVCLFIFPLFTGFSFHNAEIKNIPLNFRTPFPADSLQNKNATDKTDKPAESISAYYQMHLEKKGLSKNAYDLALKGYERLLKKKLVGKKYIISIIDYSQPSDKKRLYVLDIKNNKLLFQSLVAHGRNCGLEYAAHFSNEEDSHKSSLGFYVTLGTYSGECGYALKLKGCEKGFNDKAYDRNIVMHGSDYVNEDFVKQNGYLGRSLGCPALPKKMNKKIIDVIKKGSCLFLYHPTTKYLLTSPILNG